ncbi:hypothetical protein [Thalassovita aquimarina]|uniref:Uncharacterized protein n=1 Tax=Thalassovita aquimarina TaxID=2785917 RepID=A0ABS5HSV5_9RHOB|nr:hypothetical protein [Thalassovita aquimarina]MBR9652060.1 hypothetical protein [Thalassovita aquimarina]
MGRVLSPEDFVDGRGISNRTILTLWVLGAFYNLLVGYLFSQLLSEAMIASLSEAWLIGKRITELLIYSPISIGYYLASLTGIILFSHSISMRFTRATPRQKIAVQ